MDLKIDFNTYWDLMKPDEKYENRREATEAEWNNYPEKQRAIIHWLRKHGNYSGRNPFFFIQDFQLRHHNRIKPAEPRDLNGTYEAANMLDEGTAKIAFYNGAWGTYSVEDIEQFNLQTK